MPTQCARCVAQTHKTTIRVVRRIVWIWSDPKPTSRPNTRRGRRSSRARNATVPRRTKAPQQRCRIVLWVGRGPDRSRVTANSGSLSNTFGPAVIVRRGKKSPPMTTRTYAGRTLGGQPLIGSFKPLSLSERWDHMTRAEQARIGKAGHIVQDAAAYHEHDSHLRRGALY